MIVKELIQKLQECNTELEVIVEGCDCEAIATGISRIDDRIIIRREMGVFEDSSEII